MQNMFCDKPAVVQSSYLLAVTQEQLWINPQQSLFLRKYGEDF